MVETNYTALQNVDLDRSTLTTQENLTGYTQWVINELQEFTISNDVHFIARPVNPTAISLMRNGAIGKSMFVHGKSADSGMPNGLIPVESCLSKAGKSNNANNIAKFNEENHHSLETSEVSLQLLEAKIKQSYEEISKLENVQEVDPAKILKKANISQEMFDPILSKINLVDKNGNQIFFFKNANSLPLRSSENGNKEIIYAIKQDNNYVRIDANHNPILEEEFIVPSNFNPTKVEVFSKPTIDVTSRGELKIVEQKAITADIDVLAYGVRSNLGLENEQIQDYSQNVQARQNQLERDNFNSDAEFNKVKDNIALELEHLKGMGAAPETVSNIVGYMRGRLQNTEISHGSEQYNYHFPQPLDDHWIAIDPVGKIHRINNEDELIKYFNDVKENNYTIEPNPHWGWELKDNKYHKNPELQKNFGIVNTMELKAKTTEEKAEIKKLTALKLKIGLQAIGKLTDENSLEENQKLFSNQIQEVASKYPTLIPQQLESRSNSTPYPTIIPENLGTDTVHPNLVHIENFSKKDTQQNTVKEKVKQKYQSVFNASTPLRNNISNLYSSEKQITKNIAQNLIPEEKIPKANLLEHKVQELVKQKYKNTFTSSNNQKNNISDKSSDKKTKNKPNIGYDI